MFNSLGKSENGQKSAKKQPKSSFFEQIMFLSRIHYAIDSYNAYCAAQRRFFDDLHVIIEVKKDDITKENEKTIDEQSNTGSRYNGTNKSRRINKR